MKITQNKEHLESFLSQNLEQKLSEYLLNLQTEQFSGCLDVKTKNGREWKIYFCLGRLIWAEGGEHLNRTWQRNKIKYCPQLKEFEAPTQDLLYWHSITYQLLIINLEQKYLTRTTGLALIKNQIKEIIFDLLQSELQQELSYNLIYREPNSALSAMLKKPLALINTSLAIESTQGYFSLWLANGLVFWSPNLAPQVIKPEALAKIVPPPTYQNLVKIFDGKKTLRELANLTGQDLLRMTVNLVPYVYKGIFQFVSVADTDGFLNRRKNSVLTSKITANSSSNLFKPLIIGIDDRAVVNRLVGQILKKAGYRYKAIDDSLNAVSQIVEHNPSLILLDIDMPIVNGHEICTQIRRLAAFQSTPIVMLTGHNDLVNKIKTKISGANGFVSKPIDSQDILDIVRKHL